MLTILALAALLLGGTATPNEILPGGPSVTNAAVAPAANPSVDEILPGGPS